MPRRSGLVEVLARRSICGLANAYPSSPLHNLYTSSGVLRKFGVSYIPWCGWKSIRNAIRIGAWKKFLISDKDVRARRQVNSTHPLYGRQRSGQARGSCTRVELPLFAQSSGQLHPSPQSVRANEFPPHSRGDPQLTKPVILGTAEAVPEKTPGRQIGHMLVS